ncbi:glycosyltransferase involved in cell wall biosynthesis [Desulfobaculum xiamenense]|uniref:Glycosyltransferase involved in cell wall biosynthesis n=1 Tax=Desulfobaculum xiamenense TaxID=995050 RepID=A0A846QX61_9BACT|nr:glycosyltransferase family A protein [Desulfobaculum xiamenense]NJB69209.1 glycosyltransferase involved in cell wall biosynthesis [Desulfobaculum xiamenense]
MRISVIVPTYRRPGELGRCLRSLAGQTTHGFEALVVDNAADAGVRALVEGMAAGFPVRLDYVPEPRLGLHFARNAGIRAAHGDLLLFTDDDATFASGWCAAYAEAFAAHPDMAAAGGPVRAAWEVPPPDWLVAFMGGEGTFPILSLLDGADAFRKGREVFYGVNMAVRREALVAAGGFNPEAFGEVWLGDGETGLMRALWAAERPVGYVPEAEVFHHIPPARMTRAYFERRMANGGAMDAYARHRGRVPGRLRLLRSAAGIALRSLGDWLGALVRRGTDRESLELALRAAHSRARCAYLLRLAGSDEFRNLVNRTNWLENDAHAAPGNGHRTA